MSLLDKMERRLGGLAIKNLTIWIVMGQVALFGLIKMGVITGERFVLLPSLVLEGQVWRLVTYVFFPPSLGLLSFAISIYIFFLLGRTLEQTWGEFRYNLYIFIGVAATAAASFVAPDQLATNIFLGTSVFLAFAYLFPNIEFLLFFILPVKVKWLGAFTWGIYVYTFIVGDLAARMMILAATLNFFLFFGPEMLRRGKAKKRRDKFETERRVEAEQPFHRCCICGATDQTNPDDQFYYKDGRGYCEAHVGLMDKPEQEQLAAAEGEFKE